MILQPIEITFTDIATDVLKSESKVDECTRLFLQRIGEHADKKLDMDFGQWLEM